MNLELSHDLLAKEIFARFSAEEKDVRKATRMVKDSHEFHREQLKKKREGRLLSGAEVRYISPLLDLLDLNDQAYGYLNESIEAIKAAQEAKEKAIKAKARRQRNIAVISSITGVFMLGLAIFAGLQAEKATQNADIAQQNEKLAIQTLDSLQRTIAERDAANYREHLEAGRGLMAQSLYQKAIAEFETALEFDSTQQEAKDSLMTCRSMSGVKEQHEGLMAEGQRLLSSGNSLAALEKFRAAIALGYDYAEAFQQSKIAEANLEDEFRALVESGDRLARAGSGTCPQAIQRYRKALRIKPNATEVHRKIQACQ